jgi:hypothetical protein
MLRETICFALLKNKIQVKIKSRSDTRDRANQPQHELPEWVHRARRVINEGETRRGGRKGGPPAARSNRWIAANSTLQFKRRADALTALVVEGGWPTRPNSVHYSRGRLVQEAGI